MGLGDIRVLAGILVRLTCHAAAQQTVQQNGCLRAGDVLIGGKLPVADAVDPAEGRRRRNGVKRPVAGGHVGKGLSARGDLGEAGADGDKLGAGDGLIRGKLAVADALHDPKRGKGIHRLGAPERVGDVRKGGFGGNLLLLQQAVEDLRHLSAGNGACGIEPAVRHALHIGDILIGVQLLGDAGHIGVGDHHGANGHAAFGHGEGVDAVRLPAHGNVVAAHILDRQIGEDIAVRRGAVPDDGGLTLGQGILVRAQRVVRHRLHNDLVPVGCGSDGRIHAAVRAGGVGLERHGHGIEAAVVPVGHAVDAVDREVCEGGGKALERILEGAVHAVIILLHVEVPRALAFPERLRARVHDISQTGPGKDGFHFVVCAVDNGRQFRCKRRVHRAVAAGGGAERPLHAVGIGTGDGHIDIIGRGCQRGLRQQRAEHQQQHKHFCNVSFHVHPPSQ